ncbi:helix-turn-helix transcriptional regulator [Providencia stuartii]|uniref:helix-turn-helix domain-containing protein n=1 Tax=Providencia sp. 2023EL-00965 TaxID=3084975 RepID=UPI00293FA3E9|nr:helix-turn-helix transcriptional regulator [Providencia sp. 2023EL-00965]ELR5299865.1 helix-turn-helix transcriptional regulator [Providencia stuartii]MDW7588938.1 helix-turn-helix transcriptional regulator [Providencia sp. 2023EL-00965]
MKNWGFFLRENRLKVNLTGKELGRLMHVSQQQVSRYEVGVTNLTISQLNQYLMVLGISWQDLIRNVIEEYNWEFIFNRHLP